MYPVNNKLVPYGYSSGSGDGYGYGYGSGYGSGSSFGYGYGDGTIWLNRKAITAIDAEKEQGDEHRPI